MHTRRQNYSVDDVINTSIVSLSILSNFFFNVSVTVFKYNGTAVHEKPPKYMQRASTITGQITNSSGLSHKGIKGMSIFVFLILQFG